MNYYIVLFKNKERKRIINKFVTLKKAKQFFNKLIDESDNVIFERRTENGKDCKFELGLLQYGNSSKESMYVKDDLGRNYRVELDDEKFSILNIKEYKIEEIFLDYKSRKKITTPELINTYLRGNGLKQVSKLNNKIIIQNDEKINLFTLKNENDSFRFTESLNKYCIENLKKDCLIINDYSTIHRKYMYNLLVEYGFSKSYLQTYSTTYHSEK